MKFTLQEVPLFSLIFLRMTIASLILLPFVVKSIHIKKEDFKLFFLAAFFGTNLNLAFFFLGLKFTSAINSSVILATTPIFTLIIAHIFLKEKLTKQLWIASSIAFLGVVAMVGIPIFRLDIPSTIGNLALVASSLAWVGHEIFSKKILLRYPPTVVAFFTMLIGALIFSPLFVYELAANPNWFKNTSTPGLLGLGYGIIFSSLIAYTAWQKGLAKLSATIASFVFYMLPVCGIIFSIILLGETFSPSLIFGSVLIVFGIVLAEYHRKVHRRVLPKG